MSTDFQPWTPDQPIVACTISPPDHMTVTVFGVDYQPPADLLPLTRDSFGVLMDHLWSRLEQPFTVSITETDGTVTSGVIDLRPVTPASSLPEPIIHAGPRHALPPTETNDPSQADAASPATVDAQPMVDGFKPGELVAVVAVVGTTVANVDGTVPVTLPSWVTSETLLIGRESGRTARPQPQIERW
ncbi:MAG: hypothetical protein FWF36_00230 [Propionibacteriaceae bacterium]|nr:hypothetical protein [Propionibacteriaceae bacterium]